MGLSRDVAVAPRPLQEVRPSLPLERAQSAHLRDGRRASGSIRQQSEAHGAAGVAGLALGQDRFGPVATRPAPTEEADSGGAAPAPQARRAANLPRDPGRIEIVPHAGGLQYLLAISRRFR
jgi:hypothetical protein